MYELHEGDCLEVMPRIASGSVAMAFCDLPYAFTACKWDLPIDAAEFWQHIKIVCSDTATVALTASFRFAALMFGSATMPFRYDLVWSKARASGFLQSKKAPLRGHESILIFGSAKAPYTPQMAKSWRPKRIAAGEVTRTLTDVYATAGKAVAIARTEWRYPTSVIEPSYSDKERGQHPTQKPLALLEWLIATYTNPGDTVLDPTFGSGTTGVACARLGRKFIGIEKDGEYFHRGSLRIEAAYAQAKAQEMA